ncbi:MAG: hypothetical protein U0575_08080 [Phycisphaerales bacterium]
MAELVGGVSTRRQELRLWAFADRPTRAIRGVRLEDIMVNARRRCFALPGAWMLVGSVAGTSMVACGDANAAMTRTRSDSVVVATPAESKLGDGPEFIERIRAVPRASIHAPALESLRRRTSTVTRIAIAIEPDREVAVNFLSVDR